MAFAKRADVRFAALLPVLAGLALMPGFGLALAWLAYRLSPAAALGPFVPWGTRFGSRFTRGLAVLALTLLQPIPLVGAAAGTAVLVLQHVWARKTFLA